MIARVSRKAFRTFIVQAYELQEAISKKIKWSRDDIPKQASIPPFIRDKELVDDVEGKGNILIDTFFPPLVQADFDNIQMARYPTAYQLGAITINEIIKAIKQALSFKASEYNSILNAIFKAILVIITKPLYIIFNNSLNLGYYPAIFRNSIIIALRKLGKDNYS